MEACVPARGLGEGGSGRQLEAKGLENGLILSLPPFPFPSPLPAGDKASLCAYTLAPALVSLQRKCEGYVSANETHRFLMPSGCFQAL